ncbi:MAG TPA: hypothetical protein VME43_17560 [Bryobacteraceae bacterium]|nr:hypothetical protein [Bryobacteraceae bacterium]
MATKRGTPKTKGPRPAPVNYLVKVAVDNNGNFTYTANGISDASSLRPNNGDTISWSATLNHNPVAFQVAFAGFAPFQGGTGVVRATSQPTTPLTVNLPSFYNGNLVFKYTVTIANGWSDDPIVEPVPSDGIFTLGVNPQVITLSIDSDDLIVNPPDADFTAGEVTWQWAPGSLTDDFTLTFDDPPDGWPLSATSENAILALNLQATGSSDYTIQTLHFGLSNDESSLTIG